MKSYNEMAKNALMRIDEENKLLIKRKKILKRTLIPAFAFCLAAIIGFGAMDSLGIKITPESNLEDIEYEYEYAVEEENDTDPPEDNLSGNADDGSQTPNKLTASSQNGGEATEGTCVFVVDVTYKGKTYIQTKNTDLSNYQKDKLLGNAQDLSSYCKNKNINGKVYSVKDNSEILLLEFDDGKTVLLKEVK